MRHKRYANYRPSRRQRCDYCASPAVEWLSYRKRSYPSGRLVDVHCGACAEHVGCVSWESIQGFHPEAVHTYASLAREA